jgi:DNA topoisomerase-1
MVEKLGRFGRFYACAGFPECKHTESLVKIEGSAKPITLDITCPKCNMRIAQPSSNGSGYANAPMGVGQIVAKKTKRGKIFYGCNQYPNCDMATWDKPINEFCPQCHSILVETKSQKIKCSNKDCDYKKD